MDSWDARQLWKDFLQLLPYLAAFALGGIFVLGIVLAAVKRARKKWDADFLSRYKEEARSEIEERDDHIIQLEAQLKLERAYNQELTEMRKAALTLSSKVSEVLATAQPIRTFRHG